MGAVGQVLKGSVSGTVVDPQGAVVANSEVKATLVSTGTVLRTKSDGAGLFRFNLIPTGTYMVEISGQGFKTSIQKDLVVTARSDTGLGNVQLAVGGSEATVEVSAAALLVETTQAQVNHANFSTVVPSIDTAGNLNFGSRFGLPNLTADTIPGSNLAASRRLYAGGTFRF